MVYLPRFLRFLSFDNAGVPFLILKLGAMLRRAFRHHVNGMLETAPPVFMQFQDFICHERSALQTYCPMDKKKPNPRKRMMPGYYQPGLHHDKIALQVAHVITQFPYIEERMIEVLAIFLIADRKSPARQIFRSLNSEDAR